jgi:hypothetical protein
MGGPPSRRFLGGHASTKLERWCSCNEKLIEFFKLCKGLSTISTRCRAVGTDEEFDDSRNPESTVSIRLGLDFFAPATPTPDWSQWRLCPSDLDDHGHSHLIHDHKSLLMLTKTVNCLNFPWLVVGLTRSATFHGSAHSPGYGYLSAW